MTLPDVDTSRRRTWVPAALLVGVLYLLIGRVFALPANDVHIWRLAAWIVSAGAYAAHIGYEHFRLRSSPRRTASHVAAAVAIGAFALAVAGMIHSLSTTSAIRPVWLLAMVLWPVFTAVPALLGALVAAALLSRFSRSPERFSGTAPVATSKSPTCGRVKLLHPVGGGTMGS